MNSNPPSPKIEQWGVDTDQARVAVLSVHGRGQAPKFMETLSESFDQSSLIFYAPEAPGNAWYPNSFLAPLSENEPQLSNAVKILRHCLAVMRADGFPPERIVIWGFSQGACLLSHLIRLHPERYAGIILFTGGFLGPDEIKRNEGEPLLGVPVVLRSIEKDPWVPSDRVLQTAKILRDSGAEVDLHIEPGDQHIITEEALSTANELLRSISAATAADL